jgi:hypothetical protein
MSEEQQHTEHATDGTQHHTGSHASASSSKNDITKRIKKASLESLHSITKVHVVAFVIFLAIALAMFANITLNMSTMAPGSGGDSYLNLWDVWWVNYAIFNLHATIWQTNLLFWPIGGDLTTQTMSPLGAILTLPFQAINVPFAYNVLFFLGFAFSGITMFFLADYLTRNKYAAFFAGLVFAFSAVHIAQSYSHIDWISVEWIPLALLFFLKLLNSNNKRYRDVVGFSVAFVLISFMGDMEQALMSVMLFVLVLAVYAFNKHGRRLLLNMKFWQAIVISMILAFILGSFGYLPILHTILSPQGISGVNSLNDIQHNEIWSANLFSFFIPSYYNGIFNSLFSKAYNSQYSIFSPDPTERTAYIGYIVLALALYAIYTDRNNAKLWLAIGIVFAWLAMGPYIQIGTSVTGLPGLYYLYHSIPALNIIREPGRFDFIATVAIAMLAALGVKGLLTTLEKRKDILRNSMFVIAVLSVLFLIGNNGIPIGKALASQVSTSATIPQFYTDIGNTTGNYSVLVLPALPDPSSSQPNLYPGLATYYMTAARKPLVGGDITRTNQSDDLSLYNIPLAIEASNLQAYGEFMYFSPINENYTNQTLMTLYQYNTAFVALNEQAYNQSSLYAIGGYLVKTFGSPLYSDNTTVAFYTANAIRSSVFRSYISYPVLPDWSGAQARINGNNVTIWGPTNQGAVLTYAPYRDANDITSVNSNRVYTINTTLTVYAASTGAPATLYVEELPQGGSTSAQVIASFNVTRNIGEYAANIILVSGPSGNDLFFIPKGGPSTSQTPPVEIVNITFSRG